MVVKVHGHDKCRERRSLVGSAKGWFRRIAHDKEAAMAPMLTSPVQV